MHPPNPEQPKQLTLLEVPCSMCEYIRERYDGSGPSHRGSARCKSGSLASGGKNAHCSCDTCF